MKPLPIRFFRDDFFWLSNFSPSPMIWHGYRCATAEHAYQVSKCANDADKHRIASATTPGQAKRLGRTVQCVKMWEIFKISVMRAVLEEKFKDQSLRAKLLDTYPRPLQEGNTWGDTFWGVTPTGQGDNHLGKHLMTLRSEYRANI